MGEAIVLDSTTVISQLTNALTIVIIERNLILAEELDEKKKDRTKKLHSVILNMLKKTAAVSSHHEDSKISAPCLRFINSDNVGMAQFELTH